VPEHKSYGGDARNEVAGSPAGRGNDSTARTVDAGRDWGPGDRSGEREDEAKPVPDRSKTPNLISK
jgi:hypothetical protein